MIRPTPSSVQFRVVEEIHRSGEPGFWAHPDWASSFPWLIQGTTGPRFETKHGLEMGKGARDFALFGKAPVPEAPGAWRDLGRSLGFHRVVASRQIHGTELLLHSSSGSESIRGEEGKIVPGQGPALPSESSGGLRLGPDADGHLTTEAGVLLGVTVADCTPVFLVDSEHRAIGLLHGGWRGVALGIVEKGLEEMQNRFGTSPENLHVHLGPAICGDCYEVGPEVFQALNLPVPGGPGLLDLRGVIAARAMKGGVQEGQITVSSFCTLCGDSPFYSHRGGDEGRQAGFLGIRT